MGNKHFDEKMPNTTEIVESTGDYVAAKAFVHGNRYIITTIYNGEYYGFAYNESGFHAEKVTVNGEAAIPDSDSVKWTSAPDATIESVSAPGSFIYASSHGIITFAAGRTFIYDAEFKHILMHNLYYLTFDGIGFGLSKEVSDACEVFIFEKEMPKVEVEEKYIPDGSDLPPIVRNSVKNADGSITLAFVSDTHHSISYSRNNLDVWLRNIKTHTDYIDAMGFCGDLGSAYSITPSEYWTNTQGLIDYMDNEIAGGYIGAAVYTFGNHEWYPWAGGDYMNNYENNPAADRLLRVGEGMRTDNYIIYCLGAGSISTKMSQDYSDEDIAKVEAYLSTAPNDVPIFILAHFPIHFWGDRLIENAEKLVSVFNKHPNIVVFWGHNHSDFDYHYDKVYYPGDKIAINSRGGEIEINFTYLSAGCISDTEYTGVAGGSAWVLGKGVVVTIGADGKLTFDYYTMNGDKMSERGPYFVKYRDNVKYETIMTEYVAAGESATPPEVSDIINYKFSGWDTDLTAINGHTVVTAQYKYFTGLDPAYVYFTVQEGEGVAVGKRGDPIIQYAIPYTENMTALDALKALQDAEFEGGSADVAVGTYGTITNVWGHSSANGTRIMDPASGTRNIQASDKVIAGRCYYIYAPDGDNSKETSYLSPFVNEIFVNEPLTMKAESWVFNPNNYSYIASPLNGDVYVGTHPETLADTGIDCLNGTFDITFEASGLYYVAVKSANAGLAIIPVSVNDYGNDCTPVVNGIILDLK